MNNSKERERGERDLGVEDEMKMKSKHIRVWNGIKGLFKVVALEAKKKKRSRFAISAAALQSRGAFAKVATHDTTGTESITMPCESQPGWYCLERVMRYRLNRQLIPGQIASVIQNKHGWHASLKGWTVQSRGPVIRTETTGPEIHFAQYRRGDAQSGFHWSGCFILEEWDFVGIIYNLQVSHEYFSQHVFFFPFLMFTAPFVRVFHRLLHWRMEKGQTLSPQPPELLIWRWAGIDFDGLITGDADLHPAHLFAACPVAVTGQTA